MADVIPQILAEIPPEDLLFDSISFRLVQQFHAMLATRGLSQKEFANLLGCSEAAVSKRLSGDENLTLKTIAKMLNVLSADIKIAIADSKADGFWHMMNNDQWAEERMQGNSYDTANEDNIPGSIAA